MPSYSPSTIARIGDITRGIIVRTEVLENATVLPVGSTDLFTVYGRIRVLSLDVEAITDFAADATTVQFYFDASTPAQAAVTISAASAAVGSLAAGKRISLAMTALNTAPQVDANAAVSLQDQGTMDLGCVDGVGAIGMTGAAAAQTSGTCQATLCYVPMTDGAYVEALV